MKAELKTSPLTEVKVDDVLADLEAKLADATAQAAPLVDRLSKVDDALDALTDTAPVEGGPSASLDDEIEARRAAAARRNDLQIERDVVKERLSPIQAEVERLSAAVNDEKKTRARAETLAAGRAAIARVAAAREAFAAEVAALRNTAASAKVRWSELPDLHFAVQAEVEPVLLQLRLLSNAA
jgi:chromosome segregation ATPase